MIFNLLIITALIVWITDLSGINSLPKKLFMGWIGFPYRDFAWERINPFLKILDCSTCQVFWVTLIYVIETQGFTIPYLGLCGLFAFSAPIVKDILILVKESAVKLIDKIYSWLNL